MTYYTECESPLQPLLLLSEGAMLTGLFLEAQRFSPAVLEEWIRNDTMALFVEAKRQLAAYFAGELTEFDLPLSPQGTEFQRRVWTALQQIPYGATATYGELARRLDSPHGSRAVGLANGRNPVSIIVPCHRVIGADGQLTGYGGGLERKEALLAFEAAVAAEGPRGFPHINPVAPNSSRVSSST